MSKQNTETKTSIFSIDKMVGEAINRIKKFRERDSETLAGNQCLQNKVVTEPILTIDKDGILAAVVAFAQEYSKEHSFSKEIIINGEAITHLLSIYKSVHEIFDWVDNDGLLEILLENFRDSFRHQTTEHELTKQGMNNKLEQLFLVQITLGAMLRIEKSYNAFENIIDK